METFRLRLHTDKPFAAPPHDFFFFQILEKLPLTASQVVHLQQLNTLVSVTFEPKYRRGVLDIYMRELYFTILYFFRWQTLYEQKDAA